MASEKYWDLLGAILFDSDWDVAASRQRWEDAYARTRDEVFRRRLAEARAFGAASEQLSSQRPEFSARWGMATWQRLASWVLFVGYAAWIYIAPATALNVMAIAIAIAFGLIIAMRVWAVIAVLFRRSPGAARRLESDELPTITILVPLYREAEVVPGLIAALAALDYPITKLDVKLLVEADDPETITAIAAQRLPPTFEVIPIPPGEPRTKPKALNYALAFARGEFVAVFDAEDLPRADQPREAIRAFLRGPANLAVVQAPLQIHNGADSWIAKQFALEYAIHFHVWIPLLAQLKLPVPLGGTSNYFRRDRLVEVGGWDAWNVTEDADIGLRFARFGYIAGMVAPPTLEEAPTRMRQWGRQRSRWMKGHLQTWLVLNRHPLRVIREMGLVNYLSTHLTLGGGLLASVLHAPLYLWIGLNLYITRTIEPWHWIMFALGYASAIAAAVVSGSRYARPWTVLTMLAYWPLQSLAMLKALWELQFKPHFWAKTQHFASPVLALAAPGPDTSEDDVEQLELPFFPPAAARPLDPAPARF